MKASYAFSKGSFAQNGMSYKSDLSIQSSMEFDIAFEFIPMKRIKLAVLIDGHVVRIVNKRAFAMSNTIPP